MDQSASVLAVKNRALHVSFYPELSASIIRLPQSNSAPFIFLIAQSLVHAKKSDSAETQYNLRVVECTLAALYLAHSLQLHKFYHIEGIDTSPLGFSLLSLLMLFRPRRRRRPNGHKDLDEGELQRRRIQDLLPEVDDILYQSDGYTIGEVAEHLKISEEELSKRYMTKFPIRAERFLLHQRAMHVYREALRVLDFVSILTSIARAGADAADTLSELGTLMNKSQYSLNGLYDCSCPEIEQMCKIAREHGSYGSRLTGAGWGGCTVHLVPEGRLAEIKGALEKEYYRQRDPDITEQELDRAMIVTRPGNGACLFDISKSDLI